jgi:D-aminoacyl-tRNA deacylase
MASIYGFEAVSGESDAGGTSSVTRARLEGREMSLVTVGGELVYLQDHPLFRDADLVVFLSRHQSRSGLPILSVHVPGNLSHADFGGVSHLVSIAPANAMRAALLELERQRTLLGLDGFRVYYEGTHHGPSLNVPTIFVEIGSSEREWVIREAGEAAAHAAMSAALNMDRVEAAIGIGGSHCNSRFTGHGLKSPIAFGHIVPSYAFGELSAATVSQLVERTLEENPTIILDWKGIDGRQRSGMMSLLDGLDYQVHRLAEY